jgi:hypothetical protein
MEVHVDPVTAQLRVGRGVVIRNTFNLTISTSNDHADDDDDGDYNDDDEDNNDKNKDDDDVGDDNSYDDDNVSANSQRQQVKYPATNLCGSP